MESVNVYEIHVITVQKRKFQALYECASKLEQNYHDMARELTFRMENQRKMVFFEKFFPQNYALVSRKMHQIILGEVFN